MSRFKDLNGRQYGKLVVVKESGRDSHGNVTWLCRCECGTEKVVGGDALRSSGTRSCGCATQKFRREAYAQKRKLTGSRGTGFRQLINYYKHDARRRGFRWGLSEDQFAELTQKNCQYCGAHPTQVCRPDMTPWVYNGVDRVDSTLGYEPGNTVPCCKTCNEMKLDRTVTEFLTHVQAIVTHTSQPQSSSAGTH